MEHRCSRDALVNGRAQVTSVRVAVGKGQVRFGSQAAVQEGTQNTKGGIEQELKNRRRRGW